MSIIIFIVNENQIENINAQNDKKNNKNIVTNIIENDSIVTIEDENENINIEIIINDNEK